MPDIFDPEVVDVNVQISDNFIFKGGEINLSKVDPTMTKIMVGIGWKLNAFDADSIDLDMSCFLLNKHGKTRENEDFIFYNNLQSSEGAIVHNGDCLTGAGDGDNETISLDLNNIPYEVSEIVFVLSIYRGAEKEQGMHSVRDGYLRVVNASNSHEIARYNLNEDVEGSEETAMIVASISRQGPKWHFKAIGEFVEGGLAKIATDYDIIVQEG